MAKAIKSDTVPARTLATLNNQVAELTVSRNRWRVIAGIFGAVLLWKAWKA